jgi:hypothetical protein
MAESLDVTRQKQFTMRVGADEAQQLEELAQLAESSVSDVIRRLVRREVAAMKLRREPWPLQYMHGKLREIVSSLVLADDPATITHCFTQLRIAIDKDGLQIEDEDARASWQKVLELTAPSAADAKQKGAKEQGSIPFRVARLTREEKVTIARELWDVLSYLDEQAVLRSWRAV